MSSPRAGTASAGASTRPTPSFWNEPVSYSSVGHDVAASPSTASCASSSCSESSPLGSYALAVTSATGSSAAAGAGVSSAGVPDGDCASSGGGGSGSFCAGACAARSGSSPPSSPLESRRMPDHDHEQPGGDAGEQSGRQRLRGARRLVEALAHARGASAARDRWRRRRRRRWWPRARARGSSARRGLVLGLGSLGLLRLVLASAGPSPARSPASPRSSRRLRRGGRGQRRGHDRAARHGGAAGELGVAAERSLARKHAAGELVAALGAERRADRVQRAAALQLPATPAATRSGLPSPASSERDRARSSASVPTASAARRCRLSGRNRPWRCISSTSAPRSSSIASRRRRRIRSRRRIGPRLTRLGGIRPGG